MNQPTLFEYTSAAIPIIDELKPEFLLHDTQKTVLTPNLYIKYLHINEDTIYDHDLRTASSHVFYVIKGNGCTTFNDQSIEWNKGDVFSLPYYNIFAKHKTSSDTILFYANDMPLLNYLKVKPNESRFLPTHYKNDYMMKQIEIFNKQEEAVDRNRNGILLSNEQMVDEKLNTMTHTMWSLLNYIGPNVVQKPHKHNSIAVDLCIYANNKEEGKVYTLMGKEVDKDGHIIDPIKMEWKTGCTFTTPPGWWHSHHNESSEDAWVFPVQDAGLHTYMRTLDIQFVK